MAKVASRKELEDWEEAVLPDVREHVKSFRLSIMHYIHDIINTPKENETYVFTSEQIKYYNKILGFTDNPIDFNTPEGVEAFKVFYEMNGISNRR